jgi:hypothetical protein
MKNFIQKIKNIIFTRKRDLQNIPTVQYHDKLPFPILIFHYFLVIFFHLLGTVILLYIVGMVLMYVGFVGELSSSALFYV